MKENEIFKAGYWYKKLKESTNEHFLALMGCESRYLVLMGGAGSGKSIFAGRKILERVVSERGHRILVLRKVARTLRESCFSQLCSQVAAHYKKEDFSFNKTDMRMEHKNGSSIIFAGLDDAEKLKSIHNITGIWVEEASEITRADFNQLDIRLRGESRYYKQIILSFNPIDVNHWLKKRFFDEKDENATVDKSTYLDNRFLDDAAKNVLESYRDTDEYYYRVYCLGQWGVFGKSVFASHLVAERIGVLSREEGRSISGRFASEIEGCPFLSEEGGLIKIYKKPERSVCYVIGADTAGEGSDYFTAQVLNNITGEQAAVLRARLDEDEFARQLYLLGNYYNEALIGVEANFSSFPIKELERLGYRNQYVRRSEDRFTGSFVKAYGFKTTSVSRPVIIAMLVKFVRESAGLINDIATLEEMLTFVRNEKGRAEAMSGSHDDLVMALAIALYIREQQGEMIPEQSNEPYYNFEFERQASALEAPYGKITLY